MRIEDLVASGDVVEVKGVGAPPDRVRSLGNAKTQRLYGRDMTLYLCQENAPALVDAMREAGEAKWEVVRGLAFGDGDTRPKVHFWVRQGLEHVDPTWGQPRSSLRGCRYFALTERHCEATTLADVEKLESLWRVGWVDLPDLPDFPSEQLTPEEEDRLLEELTDANEGRTEQ